MRKLTKKVVTEETMVQLYGNEHCSGTNWYCKAGVDGGCTNYYCR